MFGGVDTAQYLGSLETLPVQKELGFFAGFLITLTGVTLGSAVIAKNQAQAVLLDSGSSLTYLPDAMAEAIYEQVSAQYDSNVGAAYVPCSLAKNSTTLNFTFSSPTISVPMNELVLPITSSNSRPLVFADGAQVCLFDIAPAGSSTAVMGDTFIRSVYLVYDLSNNEISIAQSNFNAKGTNVMEIQSGTAAVRGATLVANAVTAVAGTNTGAVAGTVTLGLGGTATSKGGAHRTASPMKVGTMAVVGAGMLYAAM